MAAHYPQGYIFGKVHGTTLHLDLGDYALTDYTFYVAGELEKVLHQQRATPSTASLPANAPLLRLSGPHDPTPSYGDGQLAAVSARLRHHHAEAALLRLNCHLPLSRKASFVAALEELCEQFELEVLYYLDHEMLPLVNLMVFFGNGRQGVGGSPLRYTDTAALKPAVLATLAAHDGQTGHLDGFPADYPRRGPHVVRVVDADFML